VTGTTTLASGTAIATQSFAFRDKEVLAGAQVTAFSALSVATNANAQQYTSPAAGAAAGVASGVGAAGGTTGAAGALVSPKLNKEIKDY
jgi:hypothetical protein